MILQVQGCLKLPRERIRAGAGETLRSGKKKQTINRKPAIDFDVVLAVAYLHKHNSLFSITIKIIDIIIIKQ